MSPLPVLLDTDIGTDIDDAFALALILCSPELKLLGVTTVSGDTRARARLAGKMLSVAGRRDVPVAAGAPGKPLPIDQTRWAANFTSPQLVRRTAVELLDSFLSRHPGKITLIAIGPLTNVAALLQRNREAACSIRRIVMMGGSILRGYDHHQRPDPEYNIRMDWEAARDVFAAGIPITMAPLDVTAMLQLNAAGRRRVFTHGTPLSGALASLYRLWGHPVPTLYDPMAVALLLKPVLCITRPLPIQVDSDGYTRVEQGRRPNAMVALQTHPKSFFNFYLARVAP